MLTCDSHAQMTIITWCTIFGTDENEIHWKKIGLNQKGFIDFLLMNNNLTKDKWKESWKNMIGFRNNYIAHKSLKNDIAMPILDVAYKAALSLDLYIRKETCYVFSSPPFIKLVNRYRNQVQETIALLSV